MERNPRKTKAFIITFISVLALLIIVYFLFFNGDGSMSKTLSGIQKTFSPLLGKSNPKDINTITNPSSTSSTSSDGGANSGSNGSGASNSGGAGSGTSASGGASGNNGGGLGGSTTKNGLKYNTQCSDGVDNDGRNGKDIADKSCHTDGNANNINSYNPEGALEYDFSKVGKDATSVPQCGDGIDNDKQNGADENDKSCHTDGNEKNKKSYNKNIALEFNFKANGKNLNYTPECSDWVDTNKNGKIDKDDVGDNDNDGLIDSQDPDCHTDGDAKNKKSYDPDGALEYDFTTTGKDVVYAPQCSDWVDKNKNGIVDIGDTGDNDNDGLIDSQDPDCHTDGDATNKKSYNPDGSLEYDFISVFKWLNTDTQCSDGIDNDGNNLADTKDPGCWKDRKDSTTYNANDTVEYDINTKDYVDACTVSLMKTQLATNQKAIDKLEADAIIAYNNSFIIKAGTRGVWPKIKKGGGGAGPIGSGLLPTITECSDSADNDANGLKDESDPSCHTDGDKYNTASYDKNISKEFNIPKSGALSVFDCVDGIDNDKNGQTDDKDPGCWINMNDPKTYDPNDNYEKIEITECSDGVDNDGNKVTDSKDPACWASSKDPKSYNASLPYENLVGTFTIPHIPYKKTTVTVSTKNGTLIIPVILLGIYPGNILPASDALINSYLNSTGYDKQAVDSDGTACLVNGLVPQCNDGKDNDGDGLTDRSDKGCHIDSDPVLPWDKTKNSEIDGNKIIHPPYVPACRDGVDNDGDGKKDENDPGCHSDLNPNVILSYIPDKTSELNFIPQCRDGKDNDADTLTDEKDPGCHKDLDPNNGSSYDPNLYTEFNFIPQCRDGKDNDNNKLTDDKDPGCYTDLKITKKADGTIDTTKYDPNKAIEFKYIAQCSDGKDNDGKNGIDALDLGCWEDKTDSSTYNPEDNFEAEFSGGYVPACSDGVDNDKDTFTDASDPTCHTDGNANNNGQDSAHPNTYDPKYYSESASSYVTPPPDPTPSIASCVDVPLEFTQEEQRKLDELKRQFALIAPKLKTDADIITENDQQQSNIDLVTHVKDLTLQCYDQTSPTSGYRGPLERLSSPYYQSKAQTSYTYAPTEESRLDKGLTLDTPDNKVGHWIRTGEGLLPGASSPYSGSKKNQYLTRTGGGFSSGNKARFGIYDIKEIVDRAWREKRNLKPEEVWTSTAGYTGKISDSDFRSGKYVSNKDQEWNFTDYPGPRLNTIYAIAVQYAEDDIYYGCGDKRNSPKLTDGLSERVHNDPSNIDVVYGCPFLKGLKDLIDSEIKSCLTTGWGCTNKTSLETIDINVLKRKVDDVANKLLNNDVSGVSGIYAYPLYDFEQVLKIW